MILSVYDGSVVLRIESVHQEQIVDYWATLILTVRSILGVSSFRELVTITAGGPGCAYFSSDLQDV